MMTAHDQARNFQKLLHEKGMKYTYERKQIFEEVCALKQHFNADSLYAFLKKKGFRTARDTVYRTLPLLLESNVIQKSVGRGSRECYERVGVRGHHDHMICLHCGKVIEFRCEAIEKLQENMCRTHGFRLVFHDHRLFGSCAKCGPKRGGKSRD